MTPRSSTVLMRFVASNCGGTGDVFVCGNAILFVSFLFGRVYSVKELPHIKYMMAYASSRLLVSLISLC